VRDTFNAAATRFVARFTLLLNPPLCRVCGGTGRKATAHERDLAALRTIELEKEDISMWYDTLKYLVELFLGLFGL
jgi:hypothetical protein